MNGMNGRTNGKRQERQTTSNHRFLGFLGTLSIVPAPVKDATTEKPADSNFTITPA